jgi:hypothetical protein
VQMSRPNFSPKSRVSSAVYGGPLSESHSTPCGVRSASGPEATLDGFSHEVPDHLAGDGRRGRDVAHDLEVAAVEAEGHLHAFAAPAPNFEGVGAPP